MAIISSPSPKRLPNQKQNKLLYLFSFNTISSTSSSSFSSSQTPTTSSPCSSSSSDSMMDETIKDAHTIIHKWQIINNHTISMFDEKNKTESTLFIKSVKGLHRLMHFLVSHDSQSDKLFVAQKLIQIAMKRLQKDFHIILSNNMKSENLKIIADTMISCGYSEECINIYKNIRKPIIDETLLQLGIQKYHNNKHMLNDNNYVKTWINAAQIAIRKLFYEEKLLCKHIFASHEQIQNSCFEISTKEGAINLFKFPQLVATKCKKKLKSETVFIMLDLHNSILDLWPEIESLFSTQSVKLQVIECLDKLGDSIRSVLGELESSIYKNSCKSKVSGGGVHPLSTSVMDYLSSLANYGDSLNNVIFNVNNVNGHEQVSVKFGSIIIILLNKLERKAKAYNREALFLINNLNFIIEKVRSTTNMRFILGEEWIAIHEKKLDAYVLSYETMTWCKVIGCLPNDCINVSREKAVACFKKLYFMFEEVYLKQKIWIVVDELMRDKMKVSIVKNLVPVYEEFYAKHLVTLSKDEVCVKLLIRLSPESMMKYLLELFSDEMTVSFGSECSALSSLSLPVVPVSQGLRLFR